MRKSLKILIAEDDAVSRRVIESTLAKWGFDVVVAKDGHEAWLALKSESAPQLAIIDWMMPGMDGIQICRKVREEQVAEHCYILLLTSRNSSEEIAQGLDSGADDYLIKPCDPTELKARIRVGLRVLELQTKLVANITEDLRFNTLTQTVTSLVPHIREAIGPVIREANNFASSTGGDGRQLARTALASGLRIQAVADALTDMAVCGEVPSSGVFNDVPGSQRSLKLLIDQYEDRRWRNPKLAE